MEKLWLMSSGPKHFRSFLQSISTTSSPLSNLPFCPSKSLDPSLIVDEDMLGKGSELLKEVGDFPLSK
jgi:hypothetical protein